MAELEKYKKMVAELRAAASSASPRGGQAAGAAAREPDGPAVPVNDGGERPPPGRRSRRRRRSRAGSGASRSRTCRRPADAPYREHRRGRVPVAAIPLRAAGGSTAFGADGTAAAVLLGRRGPPRIERRGRGRWSAARRQPGSPAGRSTRANGSGSSGATGSRWASALYHGRARGTVETDSRSSGREQVHEAPGGRGEGRAPGMMSVLRLREQSARSPTPRRLSPHKNGGDRRVLRARGAARAPAHQGRARGLLRLRPVRPEVRGRPVAGELGEHGRVLVSHRERRSRSAT